MIVFLRREIVLRSDDQLLKHKKSNVAPGSTALSSEKPAGIND